MSNPDDVFVAWGIGFCIVCLLAIVVVFLRQLRIAEYRLEKKMLNRFIGSWLVVLVSIYFIFNAAFAAGMRSKDFPASPHVRMLFEGMGESAGYVAAQSLIPPNRLKIEVGGVGPKKQGAN